MLQLKGGKFLKYIRKALFTLIETFILFLAAVYVLWKKSILIEDQNLYILLFLGIFSVILFIKNLFCRLRRFRVLHFSLKKVDRMTGIEFEEFLKVHFERLGCTAKMTKTSGDYGADLIVSYKGRTIAVQAKRYHSKIGVKAVQEVIGSMRYYNADAGLVVTNSTYTPNAVNLANANDIILWDRNVLVQMMNKENMSGYLNEFL